MHILLKKRPFRHNSSKIQFLQVGAPLRRLEMTKVFSKKSDRHDDCIAIRFRLNNLEIGNMICNCKAPYPKHRQHRLIRNIANIGYRKRQFVFMKSRPLYYRIVPLSPSHAHPSEEKTVLSHLFQDTILASGSATAEARNDQGVF